MIGLNNLSVHIVSFAIPYPADYGGVQDVYHKLRWLKKLGVKVSLHAWAYQGRTITPELESVCENITLYKRRIGWSALANGLPYTVTSRSNLDLLKNLNRDSSTVLFESLHTTRFIAHPSLEKRKKIFRESNIEHDYYRHLAKHENRTWKRWYFLEDARRLESWESQLNAASLFCNVSLEDQRYFRQKFSRIKHDWIPSFTPYDHIRIGAGGGSFALYHGNLAIQENAVTALMLVQLWEKHPALPPLVIAGRFPAKSLLAYASPKIEIIPNPEDSKMDELIASAGWHLMFTPQPTGIKLKFLNVLFQGGRVIANPNMVSGTGLENAVTILKDWNQLPALIMQLNPSLTDDEWDYRRQLMKVFHNEDKANRLIQHLI